jgi:hypothetical protein
MLTANSKILAVAHIMKMSTAPYLKVRNVKVTLEQVTKARKGSRLQFYYFLTSAASEGGWPKPRPERYSPGNGPITHCRGGWVRPRAGLI